MKIQPLSQLYRQCRLPNVARDILGDPLDCGNVSDMFIKGQQVLITDYNKRFQRPQPFEFYLTKERITNYISQFNDMPYVQKVKEAFGIV